MARAAVAFTIGAVGARALTVLLLPAYAAVLSPAEYGELAVIVSIGTAALAVLTFGLETPVLRTWVQLHDRRSERERYAHTLLCFLLAGPLVLGAVILALVIPTIGRSEALPSDLLMLAVFAAALNAGVAALPVSILRADHQLRPYLIVQLVPAIVNTILAVVLILVVRSGPGGWFVAGAVSAVLAVALAGALVRLPLRGTFDRRVLIAALAFGVPIIPHQLAQWMHSMSDRVVLVTLVDDAQVGVYALATQVAFAVGVTLGAITQACSADYARAAFHPEQRVGLRKLVLAQIGVAAVLSIALALLGPVLIELVFPSDFHEAANLVPWLALGFLLFGCYFPASATIALVAGHTRWIWLVSLFAGVVKIVGLYLFVPAHGLTAAAIVSAAAYGALLLASMGYVRLSAHRMVPWPWVGIISVLAASVVFYGVVAEITPDSGIDGMLSRSAAIVGLGALLWLGRRRGAIRLG